MHRDYIVVKIPKYSISIYNFYEIKRNWSKMNGYLKRLMDCFILEHDKFVELVWMRLPYIDELLWIELKQDKEKERNKFALSPMRGKLQY